MKPTLVVATQPVVVARMVVTVVPRRWNLWPFWRPEQIHVRLIACTHQQQIDTKP